MNEFLEQKISLALLKSQMPLILIDYKMVKRNPINLDMKLLLSLFYQFGISIYRSGFPHICSKQRMYH